MQLVLMLAVLLMLGGKSGTPRPELTNSDMFEVLKYISGDNGEMDKIIKEAEQVSELINAIAPLATAFGGGGNSLDECSGNSSSSESKMPDCGGAPSCDIGLCLKPIANIADDSIYNALSSAIA